MGYESGGVIVKKKIVCLLLVSVIALTAVGCSSNKNNGNNHLGNTGMPGSEAEGGYNQDITMQELKEAVVAILAENYWPNMEIDAASLEEIYLTLLLIVL